MNVGVLGAGQLGRMLALAGYPLGINVKCYDPGPDSGEDCCAAAVAPHTRAAWDDRAALQRFAKSVDVVTWEFENVPVASVEFASLHAPVYPSINALAIGQDRLLEKRLFQHIGAGVHPYQPCENPQEFDRAVAVIGLPCIAKTRRFGYDGKGQFVMRTPADIPAARAALGERACIIEQLVPFAAEVSAIAAADRHRNIVHYPLTQNSHVRGILHRSLAPAPCATAAMVHRAQEIISAAMQELQYVGVLAVEFFVTSDGDLLVNEMAPRVHNSGHWTLDGAVTSQFENHLRAVTGLPLGTAECRGGLPSVMFNIVGNVVDHHKLLQVPGLHLHDYGKTPRPGRKVAHATLHPVVSEWESLARHFDVV
jgi:5-(carboxyamino)imidazole ribonucleotide synthase